MNASEIISVLKSEIADFDRKTGVQEGGTVVRVGDGIATVYGMQHAMYGELVEFETGVRGIIQNLEEKTVGVVLLGSDYGIVEGTQVMRTKKRAGVGVGSGLIGRVVDALGAPIDGGAPMINSLCPRPIGNMESMERIPVCSGTETDFLSATPAASRSIG